MPTESVAGPRSSVTMEIPRQIELRPSAVKTSKTGIWCKVTIRAGTTFGPFIGDKVTEATPAMDSNYVWEIVDRDTSEVLFYLDATDPSKGNWMRYIHSARSREEQNILAEQDDIDIYFRAIKTIHPGEELLTWCEVTTPTNKRGRGMNKQRHRRATFSGDGSSSPSVDSPNSRTSTPQPRVPSSRRSRKKSPLVAETVSTPPPDEEEVEGGEEVDENQKPDDDDAPDEDAVEAEADDDDDDDSESLSESVGSQSKLETGSTCSQSAEPGMFQFDLKPCHVIKGRMGRKVFKCDVCSGVYRHVFSLKRHFIRSHVNYKYVTEADRLNCQINPSQQESGTKSGCGQSKDTCDKESPKCSDVGDIPSSVVNGKDYKVGNGDKVNSGNTKKELTDVAGDDVNESDRTGCKSAGKSSIGRDDGVRSTTRSQTPASDDGEEADVDMDAVSGMYRCNVCTRLFDELSQLKQHVSNHPDVPNMKAYSCDKCDMKFSHKQNLMRHQAVHTGAKPFTCKFCGKKFPTATNKKRHERIHLGRRIACDYCPSSFTQTGDLKKHVRKLHPECFNECAFCGKYYGEEKALIEHLKCSHNEDYDSNMVEGMRRRHGTNIDMDEDRAMSMRLAEHKAGFKFACTVCKKRFHDYANMCRHRRLAHQRHLLMNKKHELEYPGSPHSDHSDLDPQTYFFANVARNISENLKYCIDGKQEHLQNSDQYISWKRNSSEDVSELPDTTDNYTKYNFPPGFMPKTNFREVIKPKPLPVPQMNSPRTVLSVPTVHLEGTKSEPKIELKSESPEPEAKGKGIIDVSPTAIRQSAEGLLMLSGSYIPSPPDNKSTSQDTGNEMVVDAHSSVQTPKDSSNLPVPDVKDSNLAVSLTSKPFESSVDNGEVILCGPAKIEPFASTDVYPVQSVTAVVSEIQHPVLGVVVSTSASVLSPPVSSSLFPASSSPVRPLVQYGGATLCATSQSSGHTVMSGGIVTVTPSGQKLLLCSTISPPPKTSIAASKPPPGAHILGSVSEACKMTSKPPSSMTPIAKPIPSKKKSDGKGKSLGPPTTSQVSPSTGASPISVPSFKVCTFCRSIFHKLEHYRSHMLERHKISLPSDPPDTTESPKQVNTTVTSPLSVAVTTTEAGGEKPDVRQRVQQFIQNKTPPSTSATVSQVSPAAVVTSPPITTAAEAELPQVVIEPQLYDENGALDLSLPSKSNMRSDITIKSEVCGMEHRPADAPNMISASVEVHSMDEVAHSRHLPPNAVKYLCTVCHRDYLELKELRKHQKMAHPNVACGHLEVNAHIKATVWQLPNPVGLLNICSSQVPVTCDSRFSCTKCGKTFHDIAQLHDHIIECAEVNTVVKSQSRPRFHMSHFSKGLGRIKMRKIPRLSNQASSEEDTRPRERTRLPLRRYHKLHASSIEPRTSPMRLRRQRMASMWKLKQRHLEESSFYNQRRRRRSFELLYNPQNHVRRREMTEVLDMHKCRGCGFRFSTISLLERHIRVCTQKDKMKDLEVMKPHSAFKDSKKYRCKYCEKMFTYIGSLKKHFSMICLKRKERKKKGQKLDLSWEESVVAMVTSKEQQMAEERDEGDEIRTRRRKGKRKNHKWGYVKKKRTTLDFISSPEYVDETWINDEEEESDSSDTIVMPFGGDTSKQANKVEGPEVKVSSRLISEHKVTASSSASRTSSITSRPTATITATTHLELEPGEIVPAKPQRPTPTTKCQKVTHAVKPTAIQQTISSHALDLTSNVKPTTKSHDTKCNIASSSKKPDPGKDCMMPLSLVSGKNQIASTSSRSSSTAQPFSEGLTTTGISQRFAVTIAKSPKTVLPNKGTLVQSAPSGTSTLLSTTVRQIGLCPGTEQDDTHKTKFSVSSQGNMPSMPVSTHLMNVIPNTQVSMISNPSTVPAVFSPVVLGTLSASNSRTESVTSVVTTLPIHTPTVPTSHALAVSKASDSKGFILKSPEGKLPISSQMIPHIRGPQIINRSQTPTAIPLSIAAQMAPFVRSASALAIQQSPGAVNNVSGLPQTMKPPSSIPAKKDRGPAQKVSTPVCILRTPSIPSSTMQNDIRSSNAAGSANKKRDGMKPFAGGGSLKAATVASRPVTSMITTPVRIAPATAAPISSDSTPPFNKFVPTLNQQILLTGQHNMPVRKVVSLEEFKGLNGTPIKAVQLDVNASACNPSVPGKKTPVKSSIAPKKEKSSGLKTNEGKGSPKKKNKSTKSSLNDTLGTTKPVSGKDVTHASVRMPAGISVPAACSSAKQPVSQPQSVTSSGILTLSDITACPDASRKPDIIHTPLGDRKSGWHNVVPTSLDLNTSPSPVMLSGLNTNLPNSTYTFCVSQTVPLPKQPADSKTETIIGAADLSKNVASVRNIQSPVILQPANQEPSSTNALSKSSGPPVLNTDPQMAKDKLASTVSKKPKSQKKPSDTSTVECGGNSENEQDKKPDPKSDLVAKRDVVKVTEANKCAETVASADIVVSNQPQSVPQNSKVKWSDFDGLNIALDNGEGPQQQNIQEGDTASASVSGQSDSSVTKPLKKKRKKNLEVLGTAVTCDPVTSENNSSRNTTGKPKPAKKKKNLNGQPGDGTEAQAKPAEADQIRQAAGMDSAKIGVSVSDDTAGKESPLISDIPDATQPATPLSHIVKGRVSPETKLTKKIPASKKKNPNNETKKEILPAKGPKQKSVQNKKGASLEGSKQTSPVAASGHVVCIEPGEVIGQVRDESKRAAALSNLDRIIESVCASTSAYNSESNTNSPKKKKTKAAVAAIASISESDHNYCDKMPVLTKVGENDEQSVESSPSKTKKRKKTVTDPMDQSNTESASVTPKKQKLDLSNDVQASSIHAEDQQSVSPIKKKVKPARSLSPRMNNGHDNKSEGIKKKKPKSKQDTEQTEKQKVQSDTNTPNNPVEKNVKDTDSPASSTNAGAKSNTSKKSPKPKKVESSPKAKALGSKSPLKVTRGRSLKPDNTSGMKRRMSPKGGNRAVSVSPKAKVIPVEKTSIRTRNPTEAERKRPYKARQSADRKMMWGLLDGSAENTQPRQKEAIDKRQKSDIVKTPVLNKKAKGGGGPTAKTQTSTAPAARIARKTVAVTGKVASPTKLKTAKPVARTPTILAAQTRKKAAMLKAAKRQSMLKTRSQLK